MGSMDAPPPADALLPEGVDHSRLPLNLKSSTPKVFFIFILLFASVVELLVMAGVRPPVPCTPCAWHNRSCLAFLYSTDLPVICRSGPSSVLRKCRARGHSCPAGPGPRGLADVLIAAFVTLFPLGAVNWNEKLVKCSHPCLLIYGFRKIKTWQKLGRLCLLFGTSL